MSDRLGDAIARLLADVAVSPQAADVVARWGEAAASQLRPGGVRVVCAPSAPFASLEIRPWDTDGYGLVDIELEPGVSVLWPAIRDRFGPFEEATAMPGAGTELVARQPVVGGARVTLIVEVDEGQVLALTIRRERARP